MKKFIADGPFNPAEGMRTMERLYAPLQHPVGQDNAAAIEKLHAAGVDTTGLCSIRDAAEYQHSLGYMTNELRFEHQGKRWVVELRILRVTS